MSAFQLHIIPSPIDVVSVELCGSDLYLSGPESLVHLSIDSAMDPISHVAVKTVHKIPLIKPIVLAIPTESKLALLCDNSLSFLKLSDLSLASIPPVKGISMLCGDRYLSSPYSIVIAKRRGIQWVSVDKSLVVQKEIALGQLHTLCCFRNHVCAADGQVYKLIDYKTSLVTPLFPYDASVMKPICIVIGKSEFLLVTSSSIGMGLGVFISGAGEPVRGTLQWTAIPLFLGFQFPYVIAVLNNRMIQIHDIHTQEVVQNLPLPDGLEPTCITTASYPLELQELNSSESRGGIVQVVIGCQSSVLLLKMVPWESQAESLLHQSKTKQAISLVQQMLKREGDSRKADWIKSFYLRAGLSYFAQADFEAAFKLFKLTVFPSFALVGLYSDLNHFDSPLPEPFQKLESEHESVEEIIKSRGLPLETLKTAKSLLQIHLERPEILVGADHDAIQFVWSTLFQLYAELDYPKLLMLLDSDHLASLNESENVLLRFSRFHALAKLYHSHNNLDGAIDLWLKLASGELVDDCFPGIQVVVHVLAKSNDKKLVLRYSEWLLLRFPQRAVQIFTTRTDDLFSSSEVISHLESFGSRAVKEYLNYLVEVHRADDPIYQKIAVLYLNDVLVYANQESTSELRTLYRESLKESRQSFESFLEHRGDPFSLARLAFSNFVKTNAGRLNLTVLSDMIRESEADLVFELICILSCKHEYEKVLKMLIYDLGDTTSVEGYFRSLCTTPLSGAPPITRKEALFHLLSAYLDNPDRNHFMDEVSHLLTKFATDLEMKPVLERVPSQWTFSSIQTFVETHYRTENNDLMNKIVKKSLSQSSLTRLKMHYAKTAQSQSPIYLSQVPFRICVFCEKPLVDPKLFVRRNNGDLAHLQCDHRHTLSQSHSS